MRATLLLACGLLAISLQAVAQPQPQRRTLQGSTEQAADASGWSGRLPDGVDPRSVTGAGSRTGLDGDYGAEPTYGRGRYSGFDGIDTGPCGWNPGLGLPGSSHSAGSISSGTFRSTVRCADGYPGLPLRQRVQPLPGDMPWWPQADDRDLRWPR